jgi:hypothetical protein
MGSTLGKIVSGVTLAAMPTPLLSRMHAPVSADNSLRRKLNNWLVNAPLFNREHAARVFAETGIDAILTNDPVGIYHLTGISPVTDKMVPKQFEAYALLVAD